ncbi:MAG: hypothetical protein AAFO89_01355 [Planctomycetota bacterium]
MIEFAKTKWIAASRVNLAPYNPRKPIHPESTRGKIQWQRRRNRLVTLLVDTIEQLPGDPVRPDGYTAKELQAQADIGPDLWRTFCQLAGFDLTPRDNHRRFDFKDVEALISAAQSYGKRKGGPAAKAWEELLDMNRDALSSKP